MSTAYEQLLARLSTVPKTWLATGMADCIVSNLHEALLKPDQTVVGLDGFATGFQHNQDQVQILVTSQQWARFNFFQDDIRNIEDCKRACEGVYYVLHLAALGNISCSLVDPVTTNSANVTSFLNMLVVAKASNGGKGVVSFTYAASSSSYGGHPALPKVDEKIGKPLSPNAVAKYVKELYAHVFAKCYGFYTISLRYFNVFGKRQNPNGAYAAATPKWVSLLLKGKTVYINGNGETSRVSTFIENAIQVNLLAATSKPEARNHVYNMAVGDRSTLKQLFGLIRDNLVAHGVAATENLSTEIFVRVMCATALQTPAKPTAYWAICPLTALSMASKPPPVGTWLTSRC